MPIIVLTAVFLFASGLLWYQRPNPHVWLFGSLFLGLGWGVFFMRLVTRDGGNRQ